VTATGQLVGKGAATDVACPGRPAGPAGAGADAVGADSVGVDSAVAMPEAGRLPVTGADGTGADGPSSSDASTTGVESGWPGAAGGTGFTVLPEP
jgi:hypothetical protein